jgi:hypothetical protein
VRTISPNSYQLNRVSEGIARGSKRIVIKLDGVDAPNATCDIGETSGPVEINVRIEDDLCSVVNPGPLECGSFGDILTDHSKTVECDAQKVWLARQTLLFEGPKNCKDSAVPSPTSTGVLTATISVPGQPDYVEELSIGCNQ